MKDAAEICHEAIMNIRKNMDIKREIGDIRKSVNTKKSDWELERLLRACKGDITVAKKAIKDIEGYKR